MRLSRAATAETKVTCSGHHNAPKDGLSEHLGVDACLEGRRESVMTIRPSFSEPTIDEMLADPIVRLVMKRDGVEEMELRRTLNQVAASRSARDLRRYDNGKAADAA